MNEIWRPIEGFEDSHEVSNIGRVRTIERLWIGKTPTGHPASRVVAARICAQRMGNTGYMRVSLCRGGKPYAKATHRLVAQAFIPPEHGKDQVNHKNGNKTDNRAENLEWSTASLNQRHAIDTGLVRTRRGVERAWAKLTDDDVRAIRRLIADGVVQRRIAERFGVAPCKITMIKQGKAWAHVE